MNNRRDWLINEGNYADKVKHNKRKWNIITESDETIYDAANGIYSTNQNNVMKEMKPILQLWQLNWRTKFCKAGQFKFIYTYFNKDFDIYTPICH